MKTSYVIILVVAGLIIGTMLIGGIIFIAYDISVHKKKDAQIDRLVKYLKMQAQETENIEKQILENEKNAETQERIRSMRQLRDDILRDLSKPEPPPKSKVTFAPNRELSKQSPQQPPISFDTYTPPSTTSQYQTQCHWCNGTGLERQTCSNCGGFGSVKKIRCWMCNGNGFKKCILCSGTGKLK